MTLDSGEIAVEGSRDARTWQAYTFRWKPGSLDRAGRFTGPHLPRLDWQLWFASLAGCRGSPWIWSFAQALLEGRAGVSGLLADDPFDGAPPRWIRLTIAEYRFSDLAEWRRTGHYWTRGEASPFCPVFTLRDGALAVDDPPQP